MNKRPTYKIAFDGVKYTPEETKQAYLDLFKLLQRIQLRQIQESKDIVKEKAEVIVEAIKEQKEIYYVFDEYFDTILAGLKESKKPKKPKKKGKD